MLAKYVSYAAALAALSMVAGQSASAATIPITSFNADGIVQNGNASAHNEGDIVVGRFNSDHRVVVYPFKLPTLAPGHFVTDASLRVVLRSKSGTTMTPSTLNFNVDLYAVRVTPTNTILNDFYGVGASPITTNGSVLLQDNFATPSTANGPVTSLPIAGGNLAAYLKQPGRYVVGHYLWLRLNFDVAQGLQVGQYTFAANNLGNTNQTQASTVAGTSPAVLTLTTAIPEPATVFALAGVVGILGLSRRRQV